MAHKLTQLRFFPATNPLLQNLGKLFFDEIPTECGVYFMKNESGEIIYIGKAKSLRLRLKSYTYAHQENVSRKVLRLIHAVRSIEWELTENEEAALLKENFLLRTHRPVFNVLNTSPHIYHFVHLRLEKTGIRFHLSAIRDSTYSDVYGAFKSIGLSFKTHKAVCRLLWANIYGCKNGFEFPSYLTHSKQLDHFLFPFPANTANFYRKLKRFYSGTSKSLLIDLATGLLNRDDLAPFMTHYVQHDLDVALRFYKHCAQRNRKIRLQFKTESKLILQEQLDDFLVRLNNLPEVGRNRGKSSQNETDHEDLTSLPASNGFELG